MSTSDTEQKSILVPQHKRMAMGAPINGQSMQGGNDKPKQGALTQAAKKK
jgi:hypothetical protein